GAPLSSSRGAMGEAKVELRLTMGRAAGADEALAFRALAVLGPERFRTARAVRVPCSFGVPPSLESEGGHFPACISPSRSVCLSVSGAVAPSAPGPVSGEGFGVRSLPRESAGGMGEKGAGVNAAEWAGRQLRRSCPAGLIA